MLWLSPGAPGKTCWAPSVVTSTACPQTQSQIKTGKNDSKICAFNEVQNCFSTSKSHCIILGCCILSELNRPSLCERIHARWRDLPPATPSSPDRRGLEMGGCWWSSRALTIRHTSWVKQRLLWSFETASRRDSLYHPWPVGWRGNEKVKILRLLISEGNMQTLRVSCIRPTFFCFDLLSRTLFHPTLGLKLNVLCWLSPCNLGP